MNLRKYWLPLLILLLLVGYWALPISGQVFVLSGEGPGLSWPQFRLESAAPRPGESALISITDVHPWSFVLLTVNGEPARMTHNATQNGNTWTWRWSFTVPEGTGYTLDFYHDCHSGCVERGRFVVGDVLPSQSNITLPTKLGVVLPNPERDWHARSGWVVEIVYAKSVDSRYWSVDDLVMRTSAHLEKGLRVLVRVDYAQQQSLPPLGDYVALSEYLEFLRRLARDARLQDVYGYIIGNSYNSVDSNAMAPEQLITPAWYARVFNGYGEDVTHTDNVVQVLRSENSALRVIVGPIRPWSFDQDADLKHAKDVPWLNYMNTLVSLLDAGARAKAAAGIALTSPDGFDVSAAGHPDAPEMAARPRADEPRLDLPRDVWNGAQAGFRVYREWLEIINAYPSTQGLPVYIISTNTFDRDTDVPPAQNYPPGWLTAALEVIDAEPQIVALCWFQDYFPHSDQWDHFSLTKQPGRLVDAAEEFDALLRQP